MLEQQIQKALVAAIPNAQASVRMEGNHAHIAVVSPAFKGLMPVKRQQMVYAALNHWIASGEIHAVHIQASEA